MFRWLRREPKILTEKRQLLSAAIADYPLYQPPIRQGPNFLRRTPQQSEEDYVRYAREYVARSEQNFEYFMGQRTARLTALQTFLQEFGVHASLDDIGLANVSVWCPDNDFALVNDLQNPDVRQTFYQMKIPWTEELRGLNVIFDLGIFLGEMLIKRQPRLHWKYKHGSSDDGESAGTGHHIDGFRARAWMDPGQFIVQNCRNNLNQIYSYSRETATYRNYEALIGVVRDYSER